jgi:hypothetical protein
VKNSTLMWFSLRLRRFLVHPAFADAGSTRRRQAEQQQQRETKATHLSAFL